MAPWYRKKKPAMSTTKQPPEPADADEQGEPDDDVREALAEPEDKRPHRDPDDDEAS